MQLHQRLSGLLSRQEFSFDLELSPSHLLPVPAQSLGTFGFIALVHLSVAIDSCSYGSELHQQNQH